MYQQKTHRSQVIKKAYSLIKETHISLVIDNYNKVKHQNVIRCSQEQFEDMEVVWAVNLIPSKSSNQPYYCNISLILSFNSDETLRSHEFAFEVVGKIRGRKFISSGMINITEHLETFNDSVKLFDEFNETTLKNGSLELDMVIRFYSVRYPEMTNKIYCVTRNRRKISENISKMFDDEMFSDFVFIVKHRKFKVHKNILAAASQVFVNLFEIEMRGENKNQCEIKNIIPEVFEQVLRFIYCGKLPNDFEAMKSLSLCDAAHLYQIKDLTEIFEKEIRIMLSTENAVEIYGLACQYGFEKAKQESWKIIKRDILQTYLPFRREPLSPQEVENAINFMKKSFWQKLLCFISWYFNFKGF